MKKQILILQSLKPEFKTIYNLIEEESKANNANVYNLSELNEKYDTTGELYKHIEKADLIMCDISNLDPDMMYGLGYAHAKNKPVIILSQHWVVVPFDLRSVPILRYKPSLGSLSSLYYNPNELENDKLVKILKELIPKALKNPEEFRNLPKPEQEIKTVFVSYSHKDIQYLERLQTHLRPLENKGYIELWDDTKIKAGDKWKLSIENELKKARVAILLISADFLASDFIVNNELPPILTKAERKGTRIIPVIIKPCSFERDNNLNNFQAINEPQKPLLLLSEGEQEKIYDEISKLVEIAMKN